MAETFVSHQHPDRGTIDAEIECRRRALNLSEATLILMIANRANQDAIDRQVAEIERRAEAYYSLRDDY